MERRQDQVLKFVDPFPSTPKLSRRQGSCVLTVRLQARPPSMADTGKTLTPYATMKLGSR